MSSAVFRAESSHLYEEAHPALLNQSACFSSPEVLLGKNIDERSDVFALGCISYFMLCGRAAYLNGQIKNAIKEHGFISPPKFKNIISSDSILTYKAEPIIRKALELNAADRFSSAREFIDELIFTTGVESVACLDELLDEIRKHYISWLRRSYS
jgi:serine/threonine protein kinase